MKNKLLNSDNKVTFFNTSDTFSKKKKKKKKKNSYIHPKKEISKKNL